LALRYFISLGSNIEPHRNVPLMLQALLQIAPTVHIGRVVQTDPVGVVGAPFLNSVAAIGADLAPGELKSFFDTIEASLGRDRSDPAKKTKSRPADLDILFPLEPTALRVGAALLPREPYVLPMLLELLELLGVAAEAGPPALAPGVPLSLQGLAFGEAPRTFVCTSAGITAADLVSAPTQQ
jgi:2-amino-4-hydroxy-6-hydroxymethyldihydropteridine diphosphokinase